MLYHGVYAFSKLRKGAANEGKWLKTMPTDVIIYAVIALGLVLWLRSILGTRHGAERQRPNPFEAAANAAAQAAPEQNFGLTPEEKDAPAGPAAPVLGQIAAMERGFNPNRFIENAKEAFAMIVTAFAENDEETLSDLLAPPVLASFRSEIAGRKARGETLTAEVHAIRSAEITEARLEGSNAFITVRFVADETHFVTAADGKTIAGDADRMVQLTDIWVFTRRLRSADPRWLVVDTREGNATNDLIPDAS